MNPNNDFTMNINNNEGIENSKKLNIKVVSVAGIDFVKGNKKAILAIVWQLAKKHYLSIVGDKTEDDLIQWANDLVGGSHTSI